MEVICFHFVWNNVKQTQGSETFSAIGLRLEV